MCEGREGARVEEYRRLAEAVAARIAAGRLRPGDRLPTQRAFAHRHRVAPSTAGRVYAELVRRGLVTGEVGRGTFVRAVEPPSGRPLTQPAAGGGDGAAAWVNLELNYPVVPGQAEALSASLAPLLRPDVLAEATGTVSPRGTEAARRAAAVLFGPHADPDRILFAGNGRQAIAAALARTTARGARVGVEPLTYPLVKEIAERLGRVLVPLATDEYGIVPEAVRAERPAALYVQPVLHNPTSRTTPGARRAELAAVAAELDVPVIEDRVWAFLRAGETPAPGERTYVVDSLSKRLAPGLTVGLLYVPEGEAGRTDTALRTGGWSAARFALEAARRWLEDGTVERLSEAKRRDAAARQALVARHLAADFTVDTDPHGYYAWWELPSPWRADTFVAAARERGIAVTPGSAFAVPPYTAPRRVRLGLASPEPAVLDTALERLAALARSAGSGALSP